MNTSDLLTVLRSTGLGWLLLHFLSGITFATDTINEQITVVLVKRCLECHRGPSPAGGLALESRDWILSGGDSGPAIVPGNPDASPLLQRIHSREMPPPVKGIEQALPEDEFNILRDWIASGAEWPHDRPLDLYENTTDVRGGRDWWSFQPLQRPEIPVPVNPARTHNPIDAFIQSKLKTEQLVSAPPADSRILVRRLFYDVIGLPPAFRDLQMWTGRLDAATSEQRERLVSNLIDELLKQPQFGERWARFWLDLVRYAETSGYERDQPKTHAWKYRDWVVAAVNRDMPYDEFVRLQLAGDEIDNANADSITATGFLRLGTWNDEPNNPADYQYERLEDMVHATTSAFLGLTVKCARCHDHKFDPIPQHDYYRIASAFWGGPVQARSAKLLGGPSAEELGVADVLGWTDLTATPKPLAILNNGDRHQPLEHAVPGPLTLAPELFSRFTAAPDGSKTSHRRHQLAEWIVRPDNPLTARVCVNRIWQHHFGEALVRSPNNFGFKGELPTHPRLLDWLAIELIENGWSQKHIHRLILSSATWQQSSVHPRHTDHAQLDSGNELWWRANRRRLDAESLRDSLLAVSGELDLTRIGGPGFKPTISAEALEGLSRRGNGRTAAPEADQHRRSLYMFVSRSLMPPIMTTFDQCDTTLPCGQRDVTTAPTQALALLNNEFIHARSQNLARNVTADHSEIPQQIDAIWQRTLGRNPRNAERQLAIRHLRTQRDRFQSEGPTDETTASTHQALASLCHVLLNTNEFLYID